jgi:hypothetical protein
MAPGILTAAVADALIVGSGCIEVLKMSSHL